MNKTKFALYLTPRQLAALRQIEARTGAPVAASIRLAIDAWLKQQSKKGK